MRMQYYIVFLQRFRFDIKYRNTKLHGNADCLSRLPIGRTEDTEFDVIYEEGILQNLSITILKLASETLKDLALKLILKAIKSDQKIPRYMRFEINQVTFSITTRRPFARRKSNNSKSIPETNSTGIT